MAGLLDFNDPTQAGLLAFAANMFNAGGASPRPIGLGQALASGIGGMQQAQQQAELLARQKQEQEMQQQMYKMKLDEMQNAITEKKALEDVLMKRAQLRGLPTKQAAQEAPSSVQSYSMPTAQSQIDRVSGNYQAPQMPQAAPNQQPAPQQQGFTSRGDLVKAQINALMQDAQAYSQMQSPQAQMLAQKAQEQAIQLAKELPKYANEYRVGRDAQGNLVNIRLGDDGSEQYSPTKVAEELHFGDNGQQLIASGKYSGNTKVISPKYQSLESIATNATLRRGQDLVNDRSKESNIIASQGKIIDTSTSLRKEFEGLPEVKDYKQALPAYNSIIDAAKRNSPQSDINLVYGIAKIYDPSSVVREGEYATIANSANIPEKIKGYAQYLAGGGRFTPEVKAALIKEATGRMKSFEDQFVSAQNNYKTISKNSGADPSLLFPSEFNSPTKAQRTIVRKGKYGGRTVYEYSDGSVEYGN